MSRDSSGTFTLEAGNPVQEGTIIDVNWANPTLEDIADALTDSLARDAKGGMLANLGMGGFQINDLGGGTLGTDAPNAIQVRDNPFCLLSSVASDAGGNDYTGTALLADGPNNGTVYFFVADKDNTDEMTLRVNGGSILDVQIGGGPVPVGEVTAGSLIQVMKYGTVYRIVGGAGTGSTGFVSITSTDANAVIATHVGSQIVIDPQTNQSSGLLQLTAGNSIPLQYVPVLATSFVGLWDAGPGTNPSAGSVNGQFYLITDAGTLTIFVSTAPPVYTAQATAVQPGDAIVWHFVTTNQPTGWYFVRRTDLPVLGSDVAITPTSLFPAEDSIQEWIDAADTYLTALPADFMPITGGTFTGAPLYASVPGTASTLANKQYVDDSISALPVKVASFNTRTGAVTLTSGDVTTALTYTPVNKAGDALTGALTSSSTYGGLAFTATAYVANITGSTTLDYANGQTQVRTCTGAVTLTAISNIPNGGILRVVFKATNTGAITFPGTLVWPLGVAPDLTAGTLKKAVVVFTQDGTDLFATAAVY